MPTADVPRVRRGVALVAVVLVLLGLAPASWTAARFAPLEPVPSSAAVLDPAATAAPRVGVRELPVGLAPGAPPTTPDDLAALSAQALGPSAATVRRLLTSGDDLSQRAYTSSARGPYEGDYPGRYAEVERLLDRAPDRAATPAAVQLAAGLVVLAAVPGRSTTHRYPDAAILAWALLQRARAVGGCDAETDLLVLLASDDQPHDDVVRDLGATAVSRCPGDPTAGWVLTQFQARRAVVANLAQLSEPEKDVPGDALARARDSAAALLAAFPGSPDVRTAVGDVHLRAGVELTRGQPFTARAEYRSALAAYEQAGELGAGDAAVVGRARALVGLGRPAEAVSLLAPLASGASGGSRGPLGRALLEAQEAAHAFPAAASTAAALVGDGTAGFPSGASVFPGAEPLSLGTDRAVPLRVALAPCCGGASAELLDLAFIPAYRPDRQLTDVSSACASFLATRDTLLAGHAAAALAERPADYAPVWPGSVVRSCPARDGTLLHVLRAEAGVADPGRDVDEVEDARQNLWRWAGDLDHAAASVLGWDSETGGRDALPLVRLGEIRFLQGRYPEAAATFDSALVRAQDGYTFSLRTASVRLDRGAALVAAGRGPEGEDVLRALAADVDQGEAQFRLGVGVTADAEVAYQYAVLAYQTRLQLGDAERRDGRWPAALEDYAAARARLPLDSYDAPVFPGVLDNNRALASLGAGDVGGAREASDAAVTSDAADPVFLLTAAQAAYRGGDLDRARSLDAAALVQDPTAYPAAHDLGVALAAQGDDAGAAVAFRRAVGIRPDYAVAWFDLGVVESRRGPLRLLRSQGAFAQALRLDPSLAGQPREVRTDDTVYRTGLDVSKPLPGGWGLGGVGPARGVGAVGLLAAIGLALGASRTLMGSTADARQWLDQGSRWLGRVRLVGRRRHLGWAVAATVLAFGVPVVWHAGTGVVATVAYLVAVGLLVLGTLLARAAAAARLGVRPVQRSWPPGMLVGVLGGFVGVPWAPLPYLRAPAGASRLHLVAPVGLALTAVVMFTEAALFPVPLVRAVATAALVMTASVMLPVRPLDGEVLGRAGLVVGLGAVAAAALVLLGVL